MQLGFAAFGGVLGASWGRRCSLPLSAPTRGSATRDLVDLDGLCSCYDRDRLRLLCRADACSTKAHSVLRWSVSHSELQCVARVLACLSTGTPRRYFAMSAKQVHALSGATPLRCTAPALGTAPGRRPADTGSSCTYVGGLPRALRSCAWRVRRVTLRMATRAPADSATTQTHDRTRVEIQRRGPEERGASDS